MVGKIPRTFSVANVALAILAKRAGLKHFYVPIIFRDRQGGEPSVPCLKFAAQAVHLYKNLRELLVN